MVEDECVLAGVLTDLVSCLDIDQMTQDPQAQYLGAQSDGREGHVVELLVVAPHADELFTHEPRPDPRQGAKIVAKTAGLRHVRQQIAIPVEDEHQLRVEGGKQLFHGVENGCVVHFR